MPPDTFKTELANWLDKDVAAFRLAVCLGLMQTSDFQTKAKHVFWTDHALGNVLYQTIDSLIKAGVLEENEDEQVRWNKSSRGSWQS